MKKIIIANWKMQLSVKESLELAKQFSKKIKPLKSEVVICPDYSALPFLAPIFKTTKLLLGAQDCAAFSKGAYTGEVSANNLKTLGAKYVILGHSERREHLHENSAIINNKIKNALASKLIPVICIGEKFTERNSGETKNYLLEELRHALKGVKIKSDSDLLLAYEPVWAISTNKNAKPMSSIEADEIHAFIKLQVKKILKKDIFVLYGGSTNSLNAADYLSQKNIDGLLVGGASLNLAEFTKIVS